MAQNKICTTYCCTVGPCVHSLSWCYENAWVLPIGLSPTPEAAHFLLGKIHLFTSEGYLHTFPLLFVEVFQYVYVTVSSLLSFSLEGRKK